MAIPLFNIEFNNIIREDRKIKDVQSKQYFYRDTHLLEKYEGQFLCKSPQYQYFKRKERRMQGNADDNKCFLNEIFENIHNCLQLNASLTYLDVCIFIISSKYLLNYINSILIYSIL